MNSSYSHPSNGEVPYVDDGLHPVPATHKIEGVQNEQQYGHGPYAHVEHAQFHGGEKRKSGKILGISRAVFVLGCAVILTVAGLIVVAAVLGNMLSKQEDRIQKLQTAVDISIEGASMGVVDIPGWDYIGCHEDHYQRVLKGANQTGYDRQTNTQCKNFCEKDFKYFGTEFGDQCWCDNSPPTTEVPEWSCGTQCAGADQAEFCGGTWFLSVWKKIEG